MAPKDDAHLVADPKNGIVTPVYSDRQVIRASDLTLDRESHDAALARMRRLLHGHGIVSGFDMGPDKQDTNIWLTPGYAVAPSGAEIFLPHPVELRDLIEMIPAVCLPSDDPCTELDPAKQKEKMARLGIAKATIGAWLIARPAADPTDPRPGVPEGCENPGNLQLPTRLCHMVRLELMCKLPRDKVLTPPNCDAVKPYICVGLGRAEKLAYPYPDPPASADDYVVLGFLELYAKPDKTPEVGKPVRLGIRPLLANRRHVLPNAVLHDFLSACLCKPVAEKPDREDEKPDAEEVDKPGPTPGTTKPGRRADGWEVYLPEREREPVVVVTDLDDGLPDINVDDGHTDPPPHIYEELDRLRGLEGTVAGDPEGFLRASTEELVVTTGLPASTILTIKEEIVATEEVWTTEDSAPAVSNDWTDFNIRMFDGGVSTNWQPTDVAPASDSVREQPMIVAVADSPAELAEKGLAGPADVLATGDRELAATLGVTEPVAKAIKTDMMRFTGLMGR